MHKFLMILAALALALGLAGCGDDGDETADGGDFCALAENFSEFDDSAEEIFSGGGADADELRNAWTEITANFDDFREAAPGEIKDDVATVTDLVDDFTAILEEADYSITTLISQAATDPSIQERLEAFDGDDIEAASERVEKYVSDECGVDLNS